MKFTRSRLVVAKIDIGATSVLRRRYTRDKEIRRLSLFLSSESRLVLMIYGLFGDDMALVKGVAE